MLSMTSILVGATVSVAANPLSFSEPEQLKVPGLTELEAPESIDFDGDGVRDLLSGNYAGNIIVRKNTGTNAAPEYAAPTKIQREGKDIKLRHW